MFQINLCADRDNDAISNNAARQHARHSRLISKSNSIETIKLKSINVRAVCRRDHRELCGILLARCTFWEVSWNKPKSNFEMFFFFKKKPSLASCQTPRSTTLYQYNTTYEMWANSTHAKLITLSIVSFEGYGSIRTRTNIFLKTNERKSNDFNNNDHQLFPFERPQRLRRQHSHRAQQQPIIANTINSYCFHPENDIDVRVQLGCDRMHRIAQNRRHRASASLAQQP